MFAAKNGLSRLTLMVLALGMVAGLLFGGTALAQKKGKTNKAKPADMVKPAETGSQTETAPAPAATPATSTTPAPAENAGPVQYKIGVVNLKDAVEQCKKRQRKYGELQSEVDSLQKEIKDMGDKIQKAKDDYENTKATMTDEQRVELKNKIEADYQTYKSEFDKRQKTIDGKEEKVLMEVFKDVDKIISQLAESEHFHLVLNTGGAPRGAVLYYSPTIDLTPKVIEMLNKMTP